MQRYVGRALIAGLCVAAFAAAVALLSGDFDETHGRVIGTSLGFSVFSAFAGAGDALRGHAEGGRGAVGAATIGLSVAAFVLLLVPVWIDDDGEEAWQVWGVVAVLSLCGSHASLVLRAQRVTDTPLIGGLVSVSIAAAVFDSVLAVLWIAEAFDDVDEAWGRFAAVVLILMFLTTALPPLLRRFGAEGPAPQAISLRMLADEVAGVADRLDRIQHPADARREAAALRELADRARR